MMEDKTTKTRDNRDRLFLDPIEDCPDKLIWALCGYLAWTDNAGTYEDALRELGGLIDYQLELIGAKRESESKP